MLSPVNEDEEFDFYLKFAKPLILNLPDTNDRIKAATWVRYLKNDTTDPVQRGEYLKLLLFVLQRRKLFGPFATVPDETKPLEKFPEAINIQDVAKNFIEIDKQILKATLQKGGYGEWPPYNVACSSDLTEYASSQEIPNFGVQAFYAVSSEPLPYWNYPEKALFPIGESIGKIQPECPIIDTVSPDISCFVSGDQAEPVSPKSRGSPRPTPRISPSKGTKDAQPKGLEDVAPKTPKQPSPSQQLDEFDMDVRVPPSWGSNLVNVKDSPSPTIRSPTLSSIKDLDIEVSEQDMLDFFNDDIDLYEADVDEIASYLQGDQLVSPERPQPTGPLSPARAVSSERHTPAMTPGRHTPAMTPESHTPAMSSGRQSPASPCMPCSPLTPTGPSSLSGLISSRRAQRGSPMSPARTPTPVRFKTPSPRTESSASSMESPTRSPPELSPDPFVKPSVTPTPPSSRINVGESRFPHSPPQPTAVLTPDQLFNALEYIAADKDMLDFYKESLTLPDDDPAFFLQGNELLSPIHPPSPKKITRSALTEEEQLKQIEDELLNMSSVIDEDELRKLEAELFSDDSKPCPVTPPALENTDEEIKKLEAELFGEFADKKRVPVKVPPVIEPPIFGEFSDRERVPVKVPPVIEPPIKSKLKKPSSSNYFQKRMEQLEKQQLGSPAKIVATAVQQVLEELNHPSTSALQTAGDIVQAAIFNQSGEGLGGDSFIAPDKTDYGWFADLPPGSDLPQDEQQDPALWESFGWWTEDPDEIFMYFPPSPRGQGTPAQDNPYASDRDRWSAEAARTPPIFSRDPRIREGPAAQRQYTIDEFGMLSFEEPVWTSAEQYLKYKKVFSPFKDHRDIDRKTLDPSQFPKYESPTLKQRFSDIHGPQDEEQFFGAAPPDFADVSFSEQDYRPMSKVEAKWEAIKHGSYYAGLPQPPAVQSPEPDEGEWANTDFLQKTPPKFMLEPPFLATPPDYEPNPDVIVDDLEDCIAKFIDEDLKIVSAKIPVTTPQRSVSPKRPPPVIAESPPFVPGTEVEPDTNLPSPDRIPERHVIPPQKLVSWDANIGSPLKFKQADAVVIESEDQLRERNLKRQNELKLFYEDKYKSPEKIPIPPPMPHLMDSYVPRRLPATMAATKLPPPGWDYRTPPDKKYKAPPQRHYRTPTGISPPKPSPPRPRDVTMYYESPPEGFMSPTMAVSPLMFTPPDDFVMSPELSPGIEDFEVHMKPGPSYRVTGSPRTPTPSRDIFDMAERNVDLEGLDDNIDLYQSPLRTPSPTQPRAASPKLTKEQLDAEIAALEAELDLLKTPEYQPQQRGPQDVTPEIERQLWMQSVKMHEPVKYEKYKTTYVVAAPRKGTETPVEGYNLPNLHTIMSPRHPPDPEEERQERVRQMGFQAQRDVIADITEIHKKAKEVVGKNTLNLQHYTLLREIEARRYKPKLNLPPSPPEVVPSPECAPHMLDEAVPEGLPTGLIQPSGWTYKTPPHLKYKIPEERQYQTPTGISPPRPRRPAPEGTLFYESPPFLVDSPQSISQEIKLDFSSPDGREDFVAISQHQVQRMPTAEDFQAPDILDIAQMYPDEFEDIDEEPAELYETPPGPKSPIRPQREPSPEMTQANLEAEIAALEAEVFKETTPKERRPKPANDMTPEHERRIWLESIKLHDAVPYDTRRIWVCPAPAKVKNTEREVTGLQAPPLRTIMSPRRPVDPAKQRAEEKLQRKFKAGRELMSDITALYKPWKARAQYDPNYFKRIQDELRSRREQYAQCQPIVEFPASPRTSPVPAPHLLDEALPEDLPPGLLPPSGWNWKTPPNLRYNIPQARRYRTPTGISPPRSKAVTMFYESPPEGLDFSVSEDDGMQLVYDTSADSSRGASPPRATDVFDMAMVHAPGFDDLDAGPVDLYMSPPGGQSPSPTRPPPRRAPDVVDMAMVCPGDFQGLDDGPVELYVSPPGIKTPSPIRSPPRPEDFKTPDIFDMAMMYPTGFEDIGTGAVDLYESPPKTPSPRQQGAASPKLTKEQLDAEIAALEAELDLLKTPEYQPQQRGPQDVTPEIERQLWMQSVKMHEPVKYEKYKTTYVVAAPRKGTETPVEGYNLPNLHTIMSPRHPPDPEEERQERVRQMGFQAQRDVIADITEIHKKAKEVVGKNTLRYLQHIIKVDDYYTLLREIEARRYKPKLNLPPSPPEVVPSPESAPHMLDEAVPEGLPTGLIQPSGWNYRTPPQMRYKVPSPRKPRTPTGYTPPQRPIPRGVAMFHESPPEDLYSSPLEDSPAIMLASPARSPQRIPEAEGYRDPDVLDMAVMYPIDFNLDESPTELYESPPGRTPSPIHKTPSPRQQGLADAPITKEQLEAEIAALEAELDLLKTPEQQLRLRGPDEPTPEHERRIWQETIKLHDPVKYDQNKTYIGGYNPPKLRTIMSPRHPPDPEEQRQERVRQMGFQAQRDVIADITEIHKKAKEVVGKNTPRYLQHIIKVDDYYTLLREIEARRYKPKLNLPPSPPEVVPSAEPVPHMLDVAVPEGLPTGLIQPSGWNYRTPPQMRYTIPPERKYKTPTGVSPVRIARPPPQGSLFYESPPLLPESPGMLYESSREGTDLSMSPPVFQDISSSCSRLSSPLYASPARTPFQPQLYTPQLADISPQIISSSESVIDLVSPYPPAPPPRPRTPHAYSPKPRRIPRKRDALDPNIFYASTPKSAVKNYQPRPEAIRFEQKRPLQMRPVSPEPPKATYYETPIAADSRPWKKRRPKPIDRNLTRKRLVFDEAEREFEKDMIQELEAHLLAASPGAPPLRGMLEESPPRTSYELDEVSMLGDLDYEPVDFTLYADPNAPQYDVRPAFEGQPDVDLMDTSPIRATDRIPLEQRDFKWMGCGTQCPWSRSP